MDLATVGLVVVAGGAIAALNAFSNAAGRASRAGTGVESAANRITSAMAALGVGLGIQQLSHYSDAWTLVGARISLVTKSTEQAAAVQHELLRIANQTRNDFDATAAIYQRLALVSDELGISQQNILHVVESVNNSLLTGGATAVEAAQSIRQLGQALGAGVLQGDEFRTVMEAMPNVAIAIAREMGVTTGELKKLSQQGAVTSDIVVKALLAVREEMAANAETIPVTIGQSMTILRNQLTATIGRFNETTGASTKLANSILSIGNNLPTVVAAIGAIAAGLVAYNVAARATVIWNAAVTAYQTVTAFMQLAASVRSFAAAMALAQAAGKGFIGIVAAVVAATVGFFAFRELMERLTRETDEWTAGMASLNDVIGDQRQKVDELTKAEQNALDAAKDRIRLAQQAVVLARLEGEAVDRQQIQFDAVNQLIEARRNLTGEVLRVVEDSIRQERDLALVALAATTEMERRNAVMEEQKRIAEEFAESIQNSFGDLFTKVVTDGLNSFAALFDGIKAMFIRMMAEMASAEFMSRWGTRLTTAMSGVFSGVPAGVLGGEPLPGGDITTVMNIEELSGSTREMIHASQEATHALEAVVVPINDFGLSLEEAIAGVGVALASFGIGRMAAGDSTSIRRGGAVGALGGAGVGAALGATLFQGLGPGVASGVGLLMGAIGGLTGALQNRKEETKRANELIETNNTRLFELRQSLDESLASGNNMTAAGGLAARLYAILQPGGTGINALGPGEIARGIRGQSLAGMAATELPRLAEQYGISLQQLGAIATEVGIELFDSGGRLIPEAFRQLGEAIGVTIQAMTTFGNSFDELQRRQNAYNKIFQIEDTPQQRVNDTFALLSTMAPRLIEALGLSGVDTASASGREAIMAGFRQIYTMIDTGTLTAEMLGAFTDKNQLLDAVLRVVDGLDEFHQTLTKVTTDYPRAMDVLLFEQTFGRGHVGTDLAVPASPGSLTPPDASGGWIIEGDIVIQANTAEDGEIILDKLSSAATSRASRGGYTYAPRFLTDR